MALTNDQILRCKLECGYNVVGIGAEVYALEGYVALFDRAIQPYVIDFSTTSATVVSASTLAPATVPVTLAANPTVAGNTIQSLAFVQGTNVVVDVGPNAELSTIQVLIGLVAYLALSNAHGQNGSYPVKVRGAEQFILDFIARIDAINSEMTLVSPKMAGMQQVDEIKAYASERGRRRQRNKHDDLVEQRLTARRDLCAGLGIPYLPDVRRGGSRGGGLSIEAY